MSKEIEDFPEILEVNEDTEKYKQLLKNAGYGDGEIELLLYQQKGLAPIGDKLAEALPDFGQVMKDLIAERSGARQIKYFESDNLTDLENALNIFLENIDGESLQVAPLQWISGKYIQQFVYKPSKIETE